MLIRSFSPLLIALALLQSGPTRALCQAKASGGWVATWAASPYAQSNQNSAFAKDTTLREIVHISAGGSAVRVILTNEFGTSDLKIGGVTVALPARSAAPTGTQGESGIA